MSTDKSAPLSCHKPGIPLDKCRHVNAAWINQGRNVYNSNMEQDKRPPFIYGTRPRDTIVKNLTQELRCFLAEGSLKK